jgi:hypothetical protein
MNCGRTYVSTEFHVVNTNSTPEVPAVISIFIKVYFNTIQAYTHTLIRLLPYKIYVLYVLNSALEYIITCNKNKSGGGGGSSSNNNNNIIIIIIIESVVPLGT